ncbi:hypothetical protein [Bradyrhizobium sp. sGM-13]|uniref:hypothetical protein n=1 Tax=Bradyrhizobium sp. sGM-13 TaxID=2831781 RepID=UPI001BCE15BC|nr:hypothetical protein [Bradyrhizobium sp. sGM-13]
MTEKKIATPEIAKATWEEMDNPSCRRVREKLVAAGYVTPSYKTINKWAAEGKWTKKKVTRKGRPPDSDRLSEKLDDAAPALTGDPRTSAEDIVNAALKALPPPEQPNEEPEAEQPKADDSEAQRQRDEQEARKRLKELRDAIMGDVSDEHLLSAAARQTLRTAIIIEGVLAELAPALIASAPEAVGKLQLAVAESLAAAGEPFDRIGAARDRAMKTINAGGAEIIPPGQNDPLADSLAAFKKRHAA